MLQYCILLSLRDLMERVDHLKGGDMEWKVDESYLLHMMLILFFLGWLVTSVGSFDSSNTVLMLTSSVLR